MALIAFLLLRIAHAAQRSIPSPLTFSAWHAQSDALQVDPAACRTRTAAAQMFLRPARIGHAMKRTGQPCACREDDILGGGASLFDWQLTYSPPRLLHLLDLGDGLGRVQPLGAGVGAIHDGVAAIELERIFQVVEPFAGGFVARIRQPAVGLQQRGGAQIAGLVPPITRARGRAARAQDVARRARPALAPDRRSADAPSRAERCRPSATARWPGAERKSPTCPAPDP